MYIFAAFISGIISFYILRFFPFLTAGSLITFSSFLVFRKKYIFIPVLAIGLIYAFVGYKPPLDRSVISGRQMVIDCITNGSPVELASGKFSNRVTVKKAADAATGEEINVINGKGATVMSPEGLRKNMSYEISARAGRDTGRLNPGILIRETISFDLETVNKSEIFPRNSIVAWFEDKREALNIYLRNNFNGDSGILLSAITTGEWSGMSEGLKDAFSATGLAHLLSISGTHFGLFSFLIFSISRLLIRAMPFSLLQRITIFLTPSQAAAILSLPFMIMYLLISGSSVPAVRSFLMINIFLFGLLIGRKGFWLNSILFAAFVICLWEPAAILGISFQLSFLAVFFIGLIFGDKKESPEDGKQAEDTRAKKGVMGRIFNASKNSLLLTLSVSAGTAPAVAYYFHYFSIISPLSNLIVTPFIGFVLVALSLFSAFVFIFTGYYPFQSLVSFASDISIKAVKAFAAMPFADIKTPAFPLIVILFFYAGVAAFFLGRLGYNWRFKRYSAASIAASVLFFFIYSLPFGKGLSVTYLDVGQGDSIVIETPDKKIITIDTGKTGRELDAYLKYLGKRELNAMIITHADDDHSAGASYIVNKFNVREIWDNGLLRYSDSFRNIPLRHLERGDLIKGQGFAMSVLHPYKGFYTFADSEAAEENNNSLVVRLTGSKDSFLFTADTAEEAEDDMTYLGKWIKSGVLKVSHHGSRFSTTEDFLKTVSPEIAIISVGKYNAYGHPHKDAIERLKGIKTYRTDRDGAIKITETSDGLKVKTYRDFQFEASKGMSAEWRNVKRLFMMW